MMKLVGICTLAAATIAACGDKHGSQLGLDGAAERGDGSGGTGDAASGSGGMTIPGTGGVLGSGGTTVTEGGRLGSGGTRVTAVGGTTSGAPRWRCGSGC